MTEHPAAGAEGDDTLRARSGGPAAIRGFRLQVLYALELLLAGAERLRLEGVEDIDLLGPDGELVEALQVKAYTVPLALSHLKSRSGGTSFFARLAALRKADPRTLGVIVSFGPVGPELHGACAGDLAKKQSLATKLAEDHGIPNADEVISNARIEEQLEADLSARLELRLRERCPVATPGTCVRLLGSWLLLCAETQAVVSQSAVDEQLQAAAEFVASCRAYADEWFRTITPLVEASGEPRESLAEEFHQGIAARFDHIVAAVDVLRPAVLDAIEDAYKTVRVVVLHGASGEGKSTLLYRFAQDRAADRLRFLVDVDADLTRSLSIANAIAAFARHARTEVQLLLDVRPGNRHWRMLIEALAASPNVRILAGVREEDWLEGYALSYRVLLRDLPVRLEAAEAKQVFDQLQRTAPGERFVSFEDAWIAFGGSGPLLEFVHLVTRHQSLKARLNEQVERLFLTLTESAARFVRLAACATGYAGRVSVVGLVRSAGLEVAEAKTLIKRLEEEYFLRRTPTGDWLEPVHPIRSRVLCELVFDPTLAPLRNGLVESLALVHHDDLERLMFESLLFDEPNDFVVCAAMSDDRKVPWSAFAGIVRAALWLDLSAYVRGMRDFVAVAKKVMDAAWWLLLPWAFAPGWSEEMVRDLAETRRLLLQRDPIRLQFADVLASSIPPVEYTRLRPLLEQGWSRVTAPDTVDDWVALSEVSYWHRLLRVSSPGPLTTLDVSLPIPPSVPLQHQLELAGSDHFRGRSQWVETCERFINRYRIVTVDDDEESLDATILLGAREGRELLQQGSEALNARAVNVASGLHALVPNRNGYGCLGIAWPRALLAHNDVHKHGMKGHLLESKWGRRVLPVLLQMIEREEFPATWRDHAEEVVRFRVGFRGFLQELLTRLAADRTWNGYWSETDWNRLDLRWVARTPTIPLCARDPWSVGNLEWLEDRDDKVTWYPARYSEYERVLRSYHGNALSLVNAVPKRGATTDDWTAVLDRAVSCWEGLAKLRLLDVAPLRPWWPQPEIDAHNQVERAFLAELLVLLDLRRAGRGSDSVTAHHERIAALIGRIADTITSTTSPARIDVDKASGGRTPAIVINLNDPGSLGAHFAAAKRSCWELALQHRDDMQTDFRTFMESIKLIATVKGTAIGMCQLSMLSVVVGNEAGFMSTGIGPMDATEAATRGLAVLASDPVGEAAQALFWAGLALEDLVECISPGWNFDVSDRAIGELIVDVQSAVQELLRLSEDADTADTDARKTVRELCRDVLDAEPGKLPSLLPQIVASANLWAVESSFAAAERSAELDLQDPAQPPRGA